MAANNSMKITTYSSGASSLPDNPSDSGYTPAEIKAALDSRSDKEIKDKFNALVDAVIAHEGASNPHGMTKEKIGLGKVDNTADAEKPVSEPQKAYIKEMLASISTGGGEGGASLPSSVQIIEFNADDGDADLFLAAYNALPAEGGTIYMHGKGTFNLTDTRLRPELTKPVTIIAYGAEISATYTVTDPTAMEMPYGLIYAMSDIAVFGGKWTVDSSFDAAFYCFGGNCLFKDCTVRATGSVFGGIYFMGAASFRVESCNVISTVSPAVVDDMPSSAGGVVCGCELGGAGGAFSAYGCTQLVMRDNIINSNVTFYGAMEIYQLIYINNYHIGAKVSISTSVGIAESFINGNYGADFSSLVGVDGVIIGENYTE